MSVKIRLKRIGSSKKPFYRIVVLDSTMTGKGRRMEDLGTYNPRAVENQVVNLKKESIEAWMKKGAQPTVAVAGLLKKAGMTV